MNTRVDVLEVKSGRNSPLNEKLLKFNRNKIIIKNSYVDNKLNMEDTLLHICRWPKAYEVVLTRCCIGKEEAIGSA
jgi:hypothetical protein